MPRFTAADERFMTQALALAERGRGSTRPNPMVGCVLVRGGEVIGSGHHREAGGPHAEVEAVCDALENVEGATMYVTLEPCCHQGKTPPCTEYLRGRGLKRVVVAMPDPSPKVNGRGIAALRKMGVTVDVGLSEERARRLNEVFWTFHALERPFIICKWAMSLDGRTSTDLGESKWISNAPARHYVHKIRSEVDAIMVGIGTVVRDDPALTVRLPGHDGSQPWRVVVDGHLKIGPNARLLGDTEGGKVLIATCKQGSRDKRRALTERGHDVVVIDSTNRRVDLFGLMRELHARGIQSVLLEGGRQLNASMLARGLIDKVVSFVAPKILGGSAPGGPVLGWGIEEMGRALRLSEVTIRQFGDNVCIEGYIARQRAPEG